MLAKRLTKKNRILMSETITNEVLKDFVVKKSSALSALELQLQSFNIFDVLNIAHREIRHSNFIGWLLDPSGSHGFGEYFLMAFINQLPEIENELLIDFNISDLGDTQVIRETENNIDIFILNERLGFSITIENKIYHKEGKDQLKKYYDYVIDRYSSLENHFFIFLTPNGNEPKDLKMKDIYQTFSYNQLTKILKQGVSEIKIGNPQIHTIMEQYIENVEKNILGKGDAVKNAQKIYKKYPKVIEFIHNNRPDFSKIENDIRTYFEGHKNYEIVSLNDKKYIRFLEKNEQFKKIFHCPEAKSWEGGYLFGFEIIIVQNSIKIKFCLGAINVKNGEVVTQLQSEKTRLFDDMKSFKSIKKFIASSTKSTTAYVAVATVPVLTLEDFFTSDHENMFEAFKSEFEKIHNEVLSEFVKEAKEKLAPISKTI